MDSCKTAKVIRTVTTPPVMAFLMVAILHFYDGLYAGNAWLWAALFLAGLPLLAYPLWAAIPCLRAKGRKTQRALAVAFSVIGYLAGAVYCLCAGVRGFELLLYLSYLISGALIALCSYAFGFRSSGHACGVAGPITGLVYRMGPWWAVGYLVLAAVFWSSLKLKRHTLPQLIAGSLFSSATIFLLAAVML